MSSGVRTSQTPNFSFQRSSTPMPYSFGKPALNCCGGSLSTFGNMKRPVAASAAADAAENAPQASPSHARRFSSGEVSSASRVAAFARRRRLGRRARRRPTPPTSSCRPRSGTGAAGGRGAAGFAACAAAAGAAGAAAGAGAGAEPSGFVSSAMFCYPITFSASSAACRTFMLRSCWLRVVTEGLSDRP